MNKYNLYSVQHKVNSLCIQPTLTFYIIYWTVRSLQCRKAQRNVHSIFSFSGMYTVHSILYTVYIWNCVQLTMYRIQYEGHAIQHILCTVECVMSRVWIYRVGRWLQFCIKITVPFPGLSKVRVHSWNLLKEKFEKIFLVIGSVRA